LYFEVSTERASRPILISATLSGGHPQVDQVDLGVAADGVDVAAGVRRREMCTA
jgi:hypothetical protein